jgi:hypothetical protein
VPLAPISHNSNLLPFQDLFVSVFIVVNFNHRGLLSPLPVSWDALYLR